ncbi:hypothetical protein F5B19DRAFT_244667 [Rostrohypoxylon terebratum]|nr:hypothetical protein F5B19DRAFT_244667 [Rostrohypoxylon terebratum]
MSPLIVMYFSWLPIPTCLLTIRRFPRSLPLLIIVFQFVRRDGMRPRRQNWLRSMHISPGISDSKKQSQTGLDWKIFFFATS